MEREQTNPADSVDVAVIGAGPAGLTAAYLLSKAGLSVAVVEADPSRVGGIARTVEYKGYRFDIGGHRFFTKSAEVEALWNELLPEGWLERERRSQIIYRHRFFAYPLRPLEAMRKLGARETLRCLLSLARARLARGRHDENLERWVSHRFGRALYQIFFRTYTEKVWGIPCAEISADWASQRIQNFSLMEAFLGAVLPPFLRRRRSVVKSMAGRFRYPRRGPGMLWEAAAAKVKNQGGSLLLGHRAGPLRFHADTGRWDVGLVSRDGEERRLSARHVISSAPLREVVRDLQPQLAALPSANALRYRDFILVAVILRERHRMADQWVYVQDPEVKVGRIQNFKAWSEEMVPDPATACYGLEYFCSVGDELWSLADDALCALAREELVTLGLAEEADFLDAHVVRQPKAYPVYDGQYAEHISRIRGELSARFPSLHLVGRNGMHRYNNQDHSMMTAAIVAENVIANRRVRDEWKVNQDARYQE